MIAEQRTNGAAPRRFIPEIAAVADYQRETCACGEEVTAERTADAWVFYCQSCGNEWSHPAPRKRFEPVKRKPRVKCKCAKACRFCGGERW